MYFHSDPIPVVLLWVEEAAGVGYDISQYIATHSLVLPNPSHLCPPFSRWTFI